MNVTLTLDTPKKGEVYVSENEGKKFVFQLVSVEDIQEQHNVNQDAPGFGCLRLKHQIPDKTIESVKKSFFKDVKL